MSALLGAWCQANPHPDARLPLFERTAPGHGVPARLSASVRRVLTDDGAGHLLPSVVSELERLRAADPVLRFWGGALGARPTANLAATAR
jgi:hypothetical protein